MTVFRSVISDDCFRNSGRADPYVSYRKYYGMKKTA